MTVKGFADLDRRVGAGLKLMASGEEALGFTPDQVRGKGWVIRARCRCGRAETLSCYQLAERGLGGTPIRGLVPRMICKRCGGQPPAIELLNPYRSGRYCTLRKVQYRHRSALDPD